MTGTVLTGSDTKVLFGFETKYGVAAETTFPFGRAVNISTADINNNLEAKPGTGKRGHDAIDVKRFEASLQIEFFLASYSVLPALIGTASENTYNAESGPMPITIAVATTVNGLNKVIKHIGCICSEATLSVSTEGALSVQATFLVSKIEEVAGTLPSTFDTAEIYKFQECNYYVDDTRASNVDSFELKIGHSSELTYELGTRFAAGYVHKTLEITGSMVHQYDAEKFRNLAYGGAAPSEDGPTALASKLKLVSLRGNAAITFDLGNCFISTYGSPWQNGDIVNESVEMICSKLVVEVA